MHISDIENTEYTEIDALRHNLHDFPPIPKTMDMLSEKGILIGAAACPYIS